LNFLVILERFIAADSLFAKLFVLSDGVEVTGSAQAFGVKSRIDVLAGVSKPSF
jgi:hypothetical protein